MVFRVDLTLIMIAGKPKTAAYVLCWSAFFRTFAPMNVEELNDKRIAVLLSGGVDSSVVVCELARLGFHPDCFYIKIGPEEQEEWECSSEEDLEMATAVARKYGCRLEVVDCHREYWEQVTAYTMDKVRAGLTPNPDVMCNRLIKFGAFHEKCGHAYDLIATGHYAQTECLPQTPAEAEETPGLAGKNLKWLCTAPDPVKDQTDFLAQIADWQLAKAIFPIGHYMKNEVREIAEREHLVSAHRKDSQGICFLGKINYNDYLRRYLGELPGDVIELETGRRVGQHRGHWFHTIGQRKGMGLGGGPWFVVRKDVAQNIVYVAHGYDPSEAYRQHFPIRAFHSLNGQMPPEEVTIKVRHTPDYFPARLEKLSPVQSDAQNALQGEGCYMVHCAVPIHGIAPGQFCVVYDKAHHRCYGSAEITL